VAAGGTGGGGASDPPRAAADAARKSRELAHWCEALAHAQPSPFLPLHVPRQRAGPPSVVVQRIPTQGTPDAPAERQPRSFFRRPLAEMTVAYSSERGRTMLSDVVGMGEGGSVFLDVMTAFEMQRHPVSCGLASLVIALNALQLAPWRQGRCPGAAAAFEMVTEDELARFLLQEGEKKSLDSDGVSLHALATVAQRVEGLHVHRMHAEGGAAGGFSEPEFRKASPFFDACALIACSHP
jgi:hypothetical protein